MTSFHEKSQSSCGKLVLRACTVLLTASATVLTALFSIVLPASRHGLLQLAIVAALFQFLTLIPLLIFCFLSPSRRSKNVHRRRVVIVFGVVPFAISASITVVSLVWLRVNSNDVPEELLGQRTTSILVASIFVWAASVLAQSLFYFSLIRAVAIRRRSALSFSCASPVGESNEKDHWKTSFSTDSSPRSKSSGRSSHSSPRPDVPALPCALPEDIFNGFDSWDTSTVSPQNKETILSLSVSDEDLMVILPMPDPVLTSRPSTARSRRATNEFQTRDLSSILETPPVVTPPEEAHIHPLFRSDSPSPPTASPGTILTASPLSGQIITPERVLSTRRSRSSLASSRHSAQSPVSPIVDDSKLLVTIPESASGPLDELPTTPMALPGFVLSAGARDSLIGYGKRKASLRDDGVEE